MFQQHYYPDHNSATDSSHMMHPFYTLGSPYPLYPTFTYSLYDRAHPPHGAFHAPPPQPQPNPQPQPQPPHRRSSMESNFPPNPTPNPTQDSRSAYGSRPFTFQRPSMKSYQQPLQPSYPLYYAHHDQDEEQYEHIHPQQQHHDQEREHDYESYIRSHSHPSRMHPRQTQHQRAFTRVHPTQLMYERNPRSRVPNRYPSYRTSNTTYHEDGHGMGLPPFQQECYESEMYPNQIDTHIPSYHEWNDEHQELQNDEDYESQSHRQVPIRVIPVTFTNVSRNNIPLHRRFLIAHKPTRPMESSDSEWDDSPSRTYQYDPNELSSMLQANPDAIRPLLLQLLPLYEPFLRQALKHDEEKDEDKKKDSIQDKENKPTTNSKINTNAKTNINTKTNKASTNATTTSTSKPPTTTSAGPTKANKGLFSKFTEPEIKKMTPPTTRMRIIHPVQEKESHLEQSQVYKVPSPSPEEMGEQLPPPARPRQLYSFTAHHEEDGKEKKEPVKEKDKPKQQDKKKDEVPSTSNKTESQRNIDIKESSTSRDIPIRGTTSASASTAPTSASASVPSSSTSTPRDTPLREPHEPKPSDISNGTSSTTSRNINIEEKKREQPKKDELKVESDQVPTSTPPPPVAEAPTPTTLTSTTPTPSSTLIHPNPHIRRHSPHVEIEDVPSTSAHHAASPVHRHTLSRDSLNPTTTTSTPVTPSATIPTPTTVTPSTITKEDEKVGPMKEEKAKPTTQEPQTQDIDTNKPTEEAQKNTSETNIKTDHTTNLDTPTGTTTTETPEVSNQHDVQVTGDSATVYDSPIHSPTSSTYSSILQSCTGSPGVSAPTSPEQQHHRMDSQDHDWHFTSPLMKTNTLNKRNEKMVDMNMMTEDKEYIITITLPEHITKHDIRLDTDVSGITVESIDDPPMFPSRSLSLPSDADINNLSAKSELIDDFHTIIVKIPKRITNKRPIRIE